MFGITGITQLFSLFGVANSMRSIISQALSGASLAGMARQLLSDDVISILEKSAEHLFPKIAPEIKLAAGVLAAYDNDKTKWLQQALNTILNKNLDVDGIYGPATRDAVEEFQTKYANFGLKVDGFAYRVTHAAIQSVLANMFGTSQPKIAQVAALEPSQTTDSSLMPLSPVMG